MSTTNSNFSQPVSDRARSKIVATVGPACNTREQLGQLIRAGVDVFRLNMAHGTIAEHEEVLSRIRWAASQQDRPIAVLADLSGPKIRLGKLLQDPLECPKDAEFEFVRGTESQAPHELTTNYDRLIDELSEGDRVLLADGTVGMRVLECKPDRVRCSVFAAGILRSRQGVNLPGVKLSVPSITEDDHKNALWAAKSNVDFVSLSFVRGPEECRELKSILREQGSEAMTIAKIEKPEALEKLDEIVLASDAIMVARGDLGVEIDIEETPVQQKRIIDTCATYRRPVIVATQMLDSMQHSRRPTRAEASDVANAILDGADACMLSGETAIGDYPFEAVETMNRIMLSTERLLTCSDRQHAPRPPACVGKVVGAVTEAVVMGAAQIAKHLQAKAVAIETRSGRTALAKSKQRNFIPTLAFSNCEQTLRQMCLFWGIEPVAGAPSDPVALRKFVDDWGKQNGLYGPGDLLVLMASGEFKTGAHNRVVVHEVR